MTPEELDEARGIEAQRRWMTEGQTGSSSWAVAARLAREGWTPPEPVDPDVLAFGDWYVSQDGKPGLRDAYLAGAHMAREQAAAVSDALVEALEDYGNWDYCEKELERIIDNYKAGKAAR